jgi:hypothetical protein
MTTATARQQFREVLAGLAAKTLTRIPALNGRVEKACKLVLAGDVALHPDGTALVNSLTDPTRAYQVTGSPATCQCQDYDRAPEHLCCHRLSVGFLRKVQELLPPAPESTPAVQPVCTSPLPEAPASVNVRLMIAGRDCQLTLRGVSEDAVLTRLEAVLRRYPVSTPPASLSPTREPELEKRYCPRHGVEMQLNHKDGRSWHSHQTDQGWCKGK